MEHTTIRDITVPTSRIGLGTWAMGGFQWGGTDDDESVRTVHAALDLGITFIDTAPAYGLGHSEEVVARALADLPRADRPYVFTKCSLVWGEDRVVRHDISSASIRREVEDSLRRLQVDVIDLYQMHWPRWQGAAEASSGSVAEAWETMADLKEQGKVRHVGVSNFTIEDLDIAEAIAPVASLQPSSCSPARLMPNVVARRSSSRRSMAAPVWRRSRCRPP